LQKTDSNGGSWPPVVFILSNEEELKSVTFLAIKFFVVSRLSWKKILPLRCLSMRTTPRYLSKNYPSYTTHHPAIVCVIFIKFYPVKPVWYYFYFIFHSSIFRTKPPTIAQTTIHTKFLFGVIILQKTQFIYDISILLVRRNSRSHKRRRAKSVRLDHRPNDPDQPKTLCHCHSTYAAI
jgi:hypothetical protein